MHREKAPTVQKTPAAETRRYPRSAVKLKATLLIHAQSGRQAKELQATLYTGDVSMSGVFFQSTFFIKVGTLVRVEFQLPKDDRSIVADGVIVREERAGETAGSVRSGFAVRFSDFHGDSGVVLASLFLAPRIKKYIEQHLKTRRNERGRDESDRLMDAIVGWELAKSQSDDIWQGL